MESAHGASALRNQPERFLALERFGFALSSRAPVPPPFVISTPCAVKASMIFCSVLANAGPDDGANAGQSPWAVRILSHRTRSLRCAGDERGGITGAGLVVGRDGALLSVSGGAQLFALHLRAS